MIDTRKRRSLLCSAGVVALLIVSWSGIAAGRQSDPMAEHRGTPSSRERLAGMVDELTASATKDPARTIELGQQALQLAEASPDPGVESRLHFALCIAFAEQQDQEQAIEHANAAELLASQAGDLQLLAKVTTEAAQIHKSAGRYDLALSCYRRSQETLEQLGDRAGVARTLNRIGIIFTRIGDYDEALAYQLRSLRINEETGDQQEIARSLNNLGVVYRNLGQHQAALEHYRRALEIKQGLGLQPDIARSLNNIGIVYTEYGEYDTALQYLEQALQLKRRLDDDLGVASTLNNLGIAHSRLGHSAQAFACLSEALSLYEEGDDGWGIANSLNDLAELNSSLGRYETALGQVARSLRVARRLGANQLIAHSLLLHSRLHEAVGNPAEALSFLREYQEVNQEIFNEQSSNRIAVLRTRYETERKERQIEVLQASRDRQRLLRNASILGLLILGLLAVVLVRSNRLKQRANQALETKNQEIETKSSELEQLNHRLQQALIEVKQLSGLLPICASCKRIRDEQGDWVQIESYIREHSEAEFSHGLCRECAHELYPGTLPDAEPKHTN